MEHSLGTYNARSGKLEPVWTLEIQTFSEDVDRILDAVMRVNPLCYGRYERNASVSAAGTETSQSGPGTTTTTHTDAQVGERVTFPMVEIKASIVRDVKQLELVMDAILEVHSFEEPVIFVREDWVSRAAYNPGNDNPNRWWNNGRGLPVNLAARPSDAGVSPVDD